LAINTALLQFLVVCRDLQICCFVR